MRTDSAENRQRIIRELKRAPRTANVIIDRLYKRDVTAGNALKRGWKYYVHLNKLFSPMEDAGIIEVVDTVKGPTGKDEKVWSLCD